MSFEFPLPDVGEGLTEADIVAWKVAPGDAVTVNQILVEIETAKSLVELPSPQAGTVGALLVEEGQTIEVGTPIIRFGGDDSGTEAAPASASAPASDSAEKPAAESGDSDGGATLVGYGAKETSSKRRPRKGAAVPAPAAAAAPVPAVAPAAEAAPVAEAVPPAPAAAPATPAQPASASASPVKPLAKPPVRKLAKDLGVDLSQVTPTGPRGDVTRDDVHAAANQATAPTAGATAPATASASDQGALEERIPFKGVTKMMAKAMVDSAFTMPHVTEFLDVDVTETMAMVRRLKSTKFLGEDVKVSPLLIVAKAVAWAVGRNPRINSCLEGDEIVVKKYVNLGIAAATPRGLIVPNIKNAQAMGLGELAQGIQDLTALARSGKTPPADQAGGTITITNVGVFGVDAGTPIINPGEAAILAFGQVRKKPWVVDDEIVPREITTLSVSADHRVVDGEIISKFLADVGRGLEDPTLMLA
ncbi:pyruvate dehydrogenase E2 component (dihydrolipoamide acetyltransferase) [Brevibacterium siliguriense]|uniref:Dihydrolipoamide acetyltransferase component of pyruvate dehydrogenase complex n=1 Tax=Brevibacterium siliguriense TaxID=1136497 RepID=A0A1H1ND30_9MICO|nr:dihydrolipoamide acetyltransferase family protein [Brevibacterium siliguriense]SDR96848.1 pyruvate dehydrogenase E2 component (dihydrolipoamide acetyltransferase) [Brevibacterium siliguriense]